MLNAIYTYQSNFELTTIERDLLPQLTQRSPIFQHFPIEPVRAPLIVWDQKGKLTGLQSARGINGEPAIVQEPGSTRRTMEPGYYGEESLIDEMDLTLRAPFGQLQGSVDITDLVSDKQDFLLQREIWRIEWVLWQMAITGRINVLSQRGQPVYNGAVQVQTASANVPWATVATATPLADLRAVRLLGRGTSHDFGAGATGYLNQSTADKMIANTNANDIGGPSVVALQDQLSIETANKRFSREGLTKLVVYDGGYVDDDGNHQLWIPDDIVVIFAGRPGTKRIGAYKQTINAGNPNMEPGGYSYVTDSADQGRPVPRRIWVGKGHNGGPCFEYPDAVVVLDVS